MIEYIQFHKDRRDDNGQRLVVRNGTSAGAAGVSGSGSDPGSSATGPPSGPRTLYQCDSAQIDAAGSQRRCLASSPYLKGISIGDFSEALTAILGEGASGLSATNIVRLKSSWETEYKVWTQRDLIAKRYVYWWADGVYFNVRLDEGRTCVLVLIGATEDGTKNC